MTETLVVEHGRSDLVTLLTRGFGNRALAQSQAATRANNANSCSPVSSASMVASTATTRSGFGTSNTTLDLGNPSRIQGSPLSTDSRQQKRHGGGA